MLYHDKAATIHLADHIIDRFKLFDYANPDCRIAFDLLDDNCSILWFLAVLGMLKWLILILRTSTKRRRLLWDNNTPKTRFKYFVDRTYSPDLSIDLRTAENSDGPIMANLHDLFQSISQKHGIYASAPFQSQEGIAVLLNFQTVPYKGTLGWNSTGVSPIGQRKSHSIGTN